MTPDEWRRVKAILEDALDRPASDRMAFIDRACGEDLALREHVSALVRAAEGEGGMIDEANAVAAGAEVPEPTGPAGERVGAYALEAEIARGGMGVVYLARRADAEFQKKVAIKLMRPGLIGEADLRRFRRSGRSSPRSTIRTSRGSSTAARRREGRPYLVMEYVEGRPIVEYCRRGGWRCARRLACFAGLRRGAARAPESRRPSRPQAGQHPRHGRRRPEAPRLRIAKLVSDTGGGAAGPTATPSAS